ncbi:NAD(P)-binding protein [Xylaria curta]|nr:NAD(P)-binding protein [Xylaria curta]
MEGSILITGANGSLAIPMVDQVLRLHPNLTALLTVRDTEDANSQKLRETVSQYPNAKVLISKLDLANLLAVQDFATKLAQSISDQTQPPLYAIIANAFYWNLIHDPEITVDGYDKTLQVSHIAHVSLILRLLGSFGPKGGRVVLFSSDAHWPGKNGLEKYPPEIPQDLDKLVKPQGGEDKFGLGFQQYACTKLAIVTWMYALNTHLQMDPKLQHITTVAINPGNLLDSRALSKRTPKSVQYMQRFVLRPLMPLVRLLLDPFARSVNAAAVDIIDLAVSDKYAGSSGYYTLLSKDESAPESREEEKQKALWTASLKWAHIDKTDTVLSSGL